MVILKIDSVELSKIAVRQSQYPEETLPEFLLVGRSNVGKSSFINTIIMRKNFAHTSSKPGKTQTLNFYLINKRFYLVDVPGYGYAMVSKDKTRKMGLMIEEYLKSRNNLVQVFLLVDFRHKPSEDDVLMYEFLSYYHIKTIVVATKYDKVSASNRAKQEKLIRETLKLKDGDELVLFSALTKKGREDIYRFIEHGLTLND